MWVKRITTKKIKSIRILLFISKKYAKLLYDEFNGRDFRTDTTIDWWLNDVIRKYNVPVYWAEPPLIDTNIYESSF